MRFFIITFFFFISLQNFGQSLKMSSLIDNCNRNGEIEGAVFDGEHENEPLIFAEVFVKETNMTVVTEIDGSFKLSLKPGRYSLLFSFIGYKSIEIKSIEVSSSSTIKLNQILNALKIESSISEVSLISKVK
ncbi:carboxypeptidase-like regulatory domain-containing protein [Gramella jeungdoensis]|uniref:Carboxypeptidase-like regulatory domain-containing protein n=2 Tax=Flavobacteriaceae TaxID=49546 RepID=A0A4Y8ASP0_9FLAO|nr:carboxypeptidase-like regulatory domain-containing protein [Gramella jeungdoensis]